MRLPGRRSAKADLTTTCCCPQVTRAKNNVILLDRDSEKRAPFFHLLRRLGLVRVVKSLMGDGADASKFGLSQVPAFWPRFPVHVPAPEADLGGRH